MESLRDPHCRFIVNFVKFSVCPTDYIAMLYAETFATQTMATTKYDTQCAMFSLIACVAEVQQAE